MENKTKVTWGQLWSTLYYWTPGFIVDGISKIGEKNGPSHGYTLLVAVVVFSLTAASIGNMSNFGAAVIAACVPVAVFAAAHKGKSLSLWQRLFAWMVALGVAVLSASLQFGSHVEGSYTISTMFSMNADLEALATSIGLPFLECAMAALAATIETANKNEYLTKKSELESFEDQEYQRSLERERQAIAVERERQSMRLDEQERLERIKANTEAQRIKAEGDAQAKIAKASVAATVRANTSERKSEQVSERKLTASEKRFQRRIKLLDFCKDRSEFGLSEAADHIGAGKTTINDDLNWFADRDVVKKWVNPDTGKTVVQVNGKEPAFRAGELG